MGTARWIYELADIITLSIGLRLLVPDVAACIASRTSKSFDDCNDIVHEKNGNHEKRDYYLDINESPSRNNGSIRYSERVANVSQVSSIIIR